MTQEKYYETPPRVTIRRDENVIKIFTGQDLETGAIIATLDDGEEKFFYDDLADTFAFVDGLTAKAILEHNGLDEQTVREIDQAPVPDRTL